MTAVENIEHSPTCTQPGTTRHRSVTDRVWVRCRECFAVWEDPAGWSVTPPPVNYQVVPEVRTAGEAEVVRTDHLDTPVAAPSSMYRCGIHSEVPVNARGHGCAKCDADTAARIRKRKATPPSEPTKRETYR
jgi:ribosomal protein L37AE/L43A